jgi:8-oxo-dGTP pyrophosphatase MutT (NUDIX family)
VDTTWDGLPVSRERPYGVSVVVWRDDDGERQWLLLHRAHEGPDYEGDWAWTPPSGARLPGEDVDACARRELLEETGLSLAVERTDAVNDDWAVYTAHAPADAEIVLDAEHDRFEWVRLPAAIARCRPPEVGAALAAANELLSATS